MKLSHAGLALSLALGAGMAQAEVTFYFNGVVDSSTPGPGGHPWAALGTPVTGSFSYDPDTPGKLSGPVDGPGQAQYGIRNTFPPALAATIGPHSLLSFRTKVGLLNDVDDGGVRDVFKVDTRSLQLDGSPSDGVVEIDLESDPGTTDALLSLALPTQLDLAKFQQSHEGRFTFQAKGLPQVVTFTVNMITNPPLAAAGE